MKFKQSNQLSEEELNAALQIQGAKLSYLVEKLNISLEEKDKLFDLLTEMSLEQLLNFTENLEEIYINKQTEDVDQDYLNKILNLKNQYQKENDELYRETGEKINQLEKHITD